MEDIEKYKLLYLIEGNTEQVLDCEKLVELYENYLFIYAMEDEENPYYMNKEYLKSVVNGFNYFYEMIFLDEVDDDFLGLKSYNMKRFSTLKEKKFEDLSVNDTIYYITWCYIFGFLEEDEFGDYEYSDIMMMIKNIKRIDNIYGFSCEKGM